MSGVITGDRIPLVRMRALWRGLGLELKGIRMSRGSTCYAIIKAEYGLKGSRQKVHDQFEGVINQAELDAGLVPCDGCKKNWPEEKLTKTVSQVFCPRCVERLSKN